MNYFFISYLLLWPAFIITVWRIKETNKAQTVCFVFFILLLIYPVGLKLADKIKPHVVVQEKIVHMKEKNVMVRDEKAEQQIKDFLKEYPRFKKHFRKERIK